MSDEALTLLLQFVFLVLPYACIACAYAALLLWLFSTKKSSSLKIATIVSGVACAGCVVSAFILIFGSKSSTAAIGFIGLPVAAVAVGVATFLVAWAAALILNAIVGRKNP